MDLKRILYDLLYEGGFTKESESISLTAEYGAYLCGPRVIDLDVKENMKKVLKDIQTGLFAKRFIDDQDKGANEFSALKDKALSHPLEQTGQKVRKLFDLS